MGAGHLSSGVVKAVTVKPAPAIRAAAAFSAGGSSARKLTPSICRTSRHVSLSAAANASTSSRLAAISSVMTDKFGCMVHLPAIGRIVECAGQSSGRLAPLLAPRLQILGTVDIGERVQRRHRHWQRRLPHVS